MPLYIEPRGSSVEQDRTPARRGPHRCTKVGYSSERLCAVDFGASCGSALAVVPASVLGELRLSNVFLRAVYCAAGCGGAFARRRSSILLLPEQLASSAPKMETTRMRIMTLSRGNRSITVRGFFEQHLYGRSTSRVSSELRLYHVA